MSLEEEGFHQARKFVMKHARTLDQKMFQYHFENGSKNEVIQALAEYQNPDGGFGKAIEPDFRLTASSPMATSVGLQYCEGIEIGFSHTMVQSAIRYLVSNYQMKGGYWPFTFLDVNEEPHAPWWHVEEIVSPSEARWSNPNAELAGYLNKYSTHVPEVFLGTVNRRALLNLESSVHIEGPIYDIICWNRAYSYLPAPLRRKAKDRIERTLRKIIPTIKEELREAHIFKLAPTPQSICYRLFPDTVEALIVSLIDRQSDNGAWWPTWKWGQYEAVWPIAEREWAGKITVECLVALKNYDLLELDYGVRGCSNRHGPRFYF